jgi:hypothetical protein
MTKKEFYVTAVIVIFCYLSLVFQINLKNLTYAEKGICSEFLYNIFDQLT